MRIMLCSRVGTGSDWLEGGSRAEEGLDGCEWVFGKGQVGLGVAVGSRMFTVVALKARCSQSNSIVFCGEWGAFGEL
jgi:hypothetical protein